ncbi:MAG: type IV toxin-antitoxin system AbiEi family antitoxin domain-containing protein [Acidimicrobiales bacterium]
MNSIIWHAITATAGTQQGLVTTAQVLQAGGTEDWIRWAVRAGRLVRIHRGVYAVAGSTSDDQALLAACLALGPTAAASHLAGVAVWGTAHVLPCLEVTTFDHQQRRLAGVTTHSSRLDRTDAVTTCRNLPVVVPALAVVQVARASHPDLVARVANDLVKRHVTTFDDVLAWIDRAHDGPRPNLRTLCERALAVGGHFDSPACRVICERLTRAGLTGFTLDYQVTDDDGVMLVDIAWPPPKVGIEYNGARDHDNPLARAKDARRRNRLAAAGWTMLQADRTMSPDDVVRWARGALAAAA